LDRHLASADDQAAPPPNVEKDRQIFHARRGNSFSEGTLFVEAPYCETEKDEPQPQVRSAFGFTNLNPAP
jgi:hypothetical protein